MVRRHFLQCLAGAAMSVTLLPSTHFHAAAADTAAPKKGVVQAIHVRHVKLTEAQFKRMTELLTAKDRSGIKDGAGLEALLRQVGYDVKRVRAINATPGFSKVLANSKPYNLRAGDRHPWWAHYWCFGIHGCWFVCCPEHFDCEQNITWLQDPLDVTRIKLRKTQFGFHGVE